MSLEKRIEKTEKIFSEKIPIDEFGISSTMLSNQLEIMKTLIEIQKKTDEIESKGWDLDLGPG